jgi:DHA1 family tetracycline resistance protein-like MFS transporter
VIGPLVATPLLVSVSGLPQGHWAIGAPMYFGAMLQGIALLLAWTHFRHHRAQAAGVKPQTAP